MKKIDTVRFGKIEVDEDKIIEFKEGIPGFEKEHEFVIVPYNEESPFVFLQSLTTGTLSFIMVNPFTFFSDYEFVLDDDILSKMKIVKEEELLVFSFLTIPSDDISQITTNLLAPIIINKTTLQAKQVILENTQYTTKHILLNSTKGDDE